MELLERLQNWFQLHCDGDWEHSYGVTIETLDNPGWQLTVDLTNSLLEDVEFQPICTGDAESDRGFWIDCKKVGKNFVGAGSADSLEKLIAVFLDWADDNSDASAWDEEVDSMIEQCKNCMISIK